MGTNSGRQTRRRGATLVLVAVSITTLAALGAVAIDLGMLFKSRGDAQKAAEAAALAGASAFMDFSPTDPEVMTVADQRARQYAQANAILNDAVAPSEVQLVDVIPDSQKVRVVVGRPAVGTWFGRILGMNEVPINARAAAVAGAAIGTKCVKPFMLPDIWSEATQDANSNRWSDDDPQWSFDPSEGDFYAPYDPNSTSGVQTGFGSGFRDGYPDAGGADYQGDRGRQMVVKPQSGNSNRWGPSNFDLWIFQNESPGAKSISERITECDDRTVNVGDTYQLAPGNKKGPIRGAIQELINRDPGAGWDQQAGEVTGSSATDWRDSPRVIKVALFDPSQIEGLQGRSDVTFNNIALFFLENVDGGDDITGRFMYYVNGSGGSGGPTASLIKKLRLVE